jgi:hypothetical protein
MVPKVPSCSLCQRERYMDQPVPLTHFALGLLLMGALPSVCLSAETPVEPPNHSYLEPLSAPGAKSGAPSFLDSASIETGTADTKATISFGGYIPKFLPSTDYLHYQINGEAPISTKGSTDEVDIGTVSGLTAGASAHAEISAILWPRGSELSDIDFTDFCESTVQKLIPGYTRSIVAAAKSDPQCGNSFLTKDNLERIVKDVNAARADCQKPDADQKLGLTHAACQAVLGPGRPAALIPDARDEKYLKNLDGNRLAQWQRSEKPLTLFTLGTTVNRQKVGYFNTSDLSTLIQDHTTGYGVNFTASRISGALMYSGGFSYEKAYKNNDTVQVCSPVSRSTSLKCPAGAIGAPKEMFSRIVFTEARWLVKSDVFAIAPRLEYDFTASKFAAKLPIYLAPNKDKVLTGGIALGYVTHGDGFGASVFVNKAFSLF